MGDWAPSRGRRTISVVLMSVVATVVVVFSASRNSFVPSPNAVPEPAPIPLRPAHHRRAEDVVTAAESVSGSPNLAPEQPPHIAPVVLAVRLIGVDDGTLDVTRVQVRPGGPASMSNDARLTQDTQAREVRIDVTSLVTSDPAVQELDVVTDHPAFLRRHDRVPLERAAATPDGVRKIELDVLLERAVTLTGTVTDSEGVPIRGAEVVVTDRPVTDSCGQGQRSPLDVAISDERGAFRLRLRPGQQHLLAAATAETRPTVRWVIAQHDGAAEESPLVLTPGYELTGCVRDADGRPMEGVTIWSSPPWSTVTTGAPTVDRAISCTNSDGRTDAAGRYRLDGLGPESQRLHLSIPDAMLDVAASLQRDVGAPAANVDFVVGASRVTLELFRGDIPLGDQDVFLVGRESTTWTTDAAGRVAVLVLPDRRHLVCVRDRGLSPYEVTFQSPPVGTERTVRIDLAERVLGPSLVVDLRGSGTDHLRHLSVRLHHPDVPQAIFTTRRVERSEDGRFRFRDLVAGRYRVVLVPGAEERGREGYCRDVTSECRLPEIGDVHLAAEVELGGRLRIAVKAPGGDLVEARCIVRSGDGTAQDVTLVEWVPGGIAMASGMETSSRAPVDVDPPLTPGRYAVEVSAEGYRPEVVDAAVDVGRTTEIDITLRPE